MAKQEKLDLSEEAEREHRNAQLASDITQDYMKRQNDRRRIENGWVLNLNFFTGNQYCDVSPYGGVVEEDQQFYWQSRKVFNHIAPTIEARIAKLDKRKPELRVRAFSDEDGDIKAAKLASGVLKFVQGRINFGECVSKAIVWSETCGSAFYKVAWDSKGGRQVAVDENDQPVYEGEVSVTVVPPFEIFPDRLDAEDISQVQSIIHAQAVTTRYIKEKFNVDIPGRNIGGLLGYAEPSAGKLPQNTFGLNSISFEDGEILLERYTRPNADFPEGKLEIAAGGKLLYEGPLPFINGEKGERGLPFVKQDCLHMPGSFFGGSVIDRLIPVQRAYNTVRNRKHEFLNRLSMGVLTVEDGSVDTDELAEDGLLPGKILVYRQGGKAPEMLDCGSVPTEFKDEEEWLEKEFAFVSGVSDLSQNSNPMRVTSATGLQLLLSQDESRLSATISSMERAMKDVARQILRLYRQFAGTARLMTLTGENKKTETYYFNAAALAVHDIEFESEETTTPEEKRVTLLKLYEEGLLTDENGKLSAENKNRILEAFGFGGYENARDISTLHIAKASEENLALRSGDVDPDVYDDHALHITEHTRFLLSTEFKRSRVQEGLKQKFLKHIQKHKEMAKQENFFEIGKEEDKV